MTNAARSLLTFQEYLAAEREASTKHEFVNGEMYAMAGATWEHNVIVGNLVVELSNALRGKSCQTLPSDMRVLTEDAKSYYPDVTVVCGAPRFLDAKRDVLLNPKVIIEVLSGSTERTDRGEKLAAYRNMPSVTDYLLVASLRRRVEHFRFGGELPELRTYVAGEGIQLATIGVELWMDNVYAGLEQIGI